MSAVNAPLGQLVELVGLPAALRLVDHFGGTCIYVPQPERVISHGKVAQVIGTEAMRKLAGAYPRERLIVPMGAAYLRAQRDVAIHADAEKLSVPELARKYETTERHVYRVLARPAPQISGGGARVSDAQGSLF